MKLFSLVLLIPLFSFVNFTSTPQYYFNDVSAVNLPLSAVSGPSMDVESADIDNDGDKDIVIAREYAPNKILINNGNGVFTDESSRIPTYSYDSEDVSLVDFDRDGDIDLLFTSEDNAVHEFYLNRGNGYFDNYSNRISNFICNASLVIDLNNDMYPDIIFGSNGNGNPAPPGLPKVYINNGDATFHEENSRLPSIAMVPQDIKAADIDGDGDKDLIFGCEDGNKIFINNGTGNFTDETATRLPLVNEETRKVAAGDIDNDGDIDLFFANVEFIAGKLRQDRILKNNGSGVFTDVTYFAMPIDNEHTLDGVFYDLNFDGFLDLITSSAFTNRPVKAFFNDGMGSFHEATNEVFPPTAVAEGLGIKIDNFNNDNLPDIFIAHRRSAQSLGNDKLLLRNDTATVGINFNSGKVPSDYFLGQNYPNPFNPETLIRFSNLRPGHVMINIYSLSGKHIETLVNENLPIGEYSVAWKPLNQSSGIYIYSLTAGQEVITKSMVFAK